MNEVDAVAALTRHERCFMDIGETLLSLSHGANLTDQQCAAIRLTVTALLQAQHGLLAEFVAEFDADAEAAYQASIGEVDSAQAPGIDSTAEDPGSDSVVLACHRGRALLEEETLYFFSLMRLTTLTGSETVGHLERTAAYAGTLAEVLGCDRSFVARIGYAARLHDVGLVAVPEEILARRGKIDSYELMLIDTHTKVGAYLVNSVAGLLNCDTGPLPMAADIALYHHERFDGLGPHGVTGEAIPYASRIFQFADVYDTLRRERPYRSAVDHGTATEIIRQGNDGATRQFDPALMSAFLHAASSFEAIFESHGERA